VGGIRLTEFDNVGFSYDYKGRVINKKYYNGHWISANYRFGESVQIPNYSRWQRIKCFLTLHQHNEQTNNCLSCGKYYSDMMDTL